MIFDKRVGDAGRIIFVLAVGVVLPGDVRLVEPLKVVARGCDGFVGVGL